MIFIGSYPRAFQSAEVDEIRVAVAAGKGAG